MPRKARKDLSTTYFHVMVQGINKEFIFDEKKHLIKYLNNIRYTKNDGQFELLAYCMMNNHAHFLFWVKDLKAFEKYMHNNNLKFAQDYNKEKNRCGVVFRNRYKVEPIFKMNHLANCIKYIHNNPVKAGIVNSPKDYPFSSYAEYNNKTGVAKSDRLKELFGDIDNYLEVINQSYDRKFEDYASEINMKEYIKSGISEFLKKFHSNLGQIFCERETLINLIVFLKKECDINYREIVNYLDMPRGSFNKILNRINQKPV